jgi:hypothetical protein
MLRFHISFIPRKVGSEPVHMKAKTWPLTYSTESSNQVTIAFGGIDLSELLPVTKLGASRWGPRFGTGTYSASTFRRQRGTATLQRHD